jgi:hypothetical protein
MKTMKPIQYRQGDVLIERVDQVPEGAVKQKVKGAIVLAHGEATGHHHALECDKADWWKRGEGLGAEQFIALPKPGRVTHQEHSTIELPAGRYRVTRQREYSPEAIRNVAD